MIKNTDLSGVWDFSFDRAAGYNDTILLPNTLSCAQKGTLNKRAEIGHLTDIYFYEGSAWFRKTAVLSCPANGSAELYLERTRKTTLLVDGRQVGSRDSLCCAHCYDLTAFCDDRPHTLELCVSNTGYPIAGGHMTSYDTQTNWLGITGKIELRQYGSCRAENVRIQSDVQNHCFIVSFSIAGAPASMISVFASLDGVVFPSLTPNITGAQVSAVIPLGEDARLWSEFTPDLYEITVDVDGDRFCQMAGLREFSADGDKFRINGKKTFLRGKHDGMIFPKTGYAPTDVDSWLAVMSTAKEYGVNHYRFHTCCPPEAAFYAADMLGIYMEPELPFWGNIWAPGEEGYHAEEQDYLIREGKGILSSFGNHPSFCMMSMGNELWGNPARINEMMGILKAHDPRPLFTQGSNDFQFSPCTVSNDDFFVGVRLSTHRLLRGSYAMCDAPLGHIQTDAPGTMTDYDGNIRADDAADELSGGSVTIQYQTGTREVALSEHTGSFHPRMPIVTHEIGQYCVYPNFGEIQKYTGPLRARNLEAFRERLKEKGLLSLADDFFRASGTLAVSCYKEELEAVLRSRLLAGCQILDLQDFSGQGTALVGILDAFMESKGLIAPEEWREFFAPCVLLARFERYVYTPGEAFHAKLQLTDFGTVSHAGEALYWQLGKETGRFVIPDYENYADIGEVNTFLDADIQPGKLEFCLWTESGSKNHYTLYVVKSIALQDIEKYCGEAAPEHAIPETVRCHTETSPKAASCRTEEIQETASCHTKAMFQTADCCVRSALDAEALALLKRGKKVLIFQRPDDKSSIPGFYCTDFWNYPMFRSISEAKGSPVAVGTLGLLIDNAHPALAGFPCERFSTPQWYPVVSCSASAILDDVPDKRVIVRTIDNFERNHDLGLIYERDLFGGTAVFCGCDLADLAQTPEGRALAASLIDYIKS